MTDHQIKHISFEPKAFKIDPDRYYEVEVAGRVFKILGKNLFPVTENSDG